jgi:NADPH:quinone reductase-like Zn-dependent oxidoreductase
MKAIVFRKYGSADVLELEEVEKPAPGVDEVLIKVCAVSINDWDWQALQGTFINRLFFGLRKPKTHRQILGSDVAGQVEAVGRNVRRFRTGDNVFGDLSGRWGGFAEYVCAHQNALIEMPSGMTYEQAAAIPQAALLALQALCDQGRIRNGQSLLINGSGGGAGTFAIQIARLYDAKITAVDRAEKLDMLRSMGAEHVIDYMREDFTRTGHRYDLIFDVKTNRSPLSYASALNRGGTYVSVGGDMARALQALILAPWISLATGKRIKFLALKPNKDLTRIRELFEEGKLVPVIDRVYGLTETAEAFRYFASGLHRGKLVITLREG